MGPDIIALFIPIIAIVMGIGIGMLAIWSDHKRKSLLLPANLAGNGDSSTPASAAKSLRSGVTLVLIGAILWVGIGQTGGGDAAWFGLIPAAVGVGNLLYALVQWNKEKRE